MHTLALVALLLVGQPEPGYITVRSSLPGIEVYLDGEYLGRAPVERYAYEPGDYLLTLVSNDSLDNIYATIRSAPVGEKLSAAWTLAAIDAGTYQVELAPGILSEVRIDYGRVLAAPGKAKTFVGCALAGLVGVGAAVGFVIGWLVFK